MTALTLLRISRLLFLVGCASCSTLAPPPTTALPRPASQKELVVTLSAYTWTAFDTTHASIKSGMISAGRGWCADLPGPCRTPTGTFHAQRKGGAGCKSNTFPMPDGGAPMPYCVFFHRGYAIHGWRGRFTKRHLSHGCVRVSVEDAQWLHNEFLELPAPENNGEGTPIRILP